MWADSTFVNMKDVDITDQEPDTGNNDIAVQCVGAGGQAGGGAGSGGGVVAGGEGEVEVPEGHGDPSAHR